MVLLSLSLLTKRTSKKFIDSLAVTVCGGAGGMGHPKYGGVGGKGGDVILVADENVKLGDILSKHPGRLVKAGIGENSHAHRLVGSPGESKFVHVPPGVSVFNQVNVKLGDLNKPDEKLVVARGGIGGCPVTQFNGQKGEEVRVFLDLKLIADVALVGFPNAGKSSFLKAVSRASPKIASYPFTTIKPQLGTVSYKDGRQITIADLPGLIEGAHRNVGLGYKFLKHVERTKLLLMLIDINGFQLGPQYPHRTAFENLVLLNKEIELYKQDIASKPALLLINKMDTEGSEEKWQQTKAAFHNYQSEVQKLPEELRPEFPIKFDDIIPLSVQKDKDTLGKVLERIRKLLDVYAELQAAEPTTGKVDKSKEDIQRSLEEHADVRLV